MLVLTSGENDRLFLVDGGGRALAAITLVSLDWRRRHARFGIVAPQDVEIWREPILPERLRGACEAMLGKGAVVMNFKARGGGAAGDTATTPANLIRAGAPDS